MLELKPDIKLKDLSNIEMDEIQEQIEIRERLLDDMVGTLYPKVLQKDIDRLKVMARYPIPTKVEGGFLYYKEGDEWKMAGRKDHPLTEKFLKQAKTKIIDSKI